MTAPYRAAQCPHCSSINGRHTLVCPETLEVWPVRGAMDCGRCREPIIGSYTRLRDAGSTGYLVACLGCAAHEACEGAA